MSQAAGQAVGQRPQVPPVPPMYKPEQMRGIPLLSADEKQKYEQGLRQLWNIYESNPEGSVENEAAKKKIQEFAGVLAKKVRERKALAGQQAQAGNPQQQAVAAGGQMANAQGGGVSGSTATAATATKPMVGGAPMTETPVPIPVPALSASAPGPQQSTSQPKYPEAVQQHLKQMTYIPPPNLPDKSPEMIARWQEDVKRKYATSLMQMESIRAQMSKFETQVKARTETGQVFSAEEQAILVDRRGKLQKAYDEAARFVGTFRKQQEMMREGSAKGGSGSGGGASTGGGAANTAAAAAATAGSQQQVRPQPTPQQQAQNKAQTPTSLQNSQANINSAFEAAKKEQIAAARHLPGANGLAATTLQQAQASQVAATSASPGGQLPSTSETGTQQAAQPQQAHPPPVNTALAATAAKAGLASAGTPTQNSARIATPQSATAPPPAPRSFSHQKALEEANKQRNSSVTSASGLPGSTAAGTPSSSGGAMGGGSQQQPGHPHAHPNPQTSTNTVHSKLPIPKQLPEKALMPVQPVSLGGGVSAGRPTYSGGGGIAGGVMGQPAVSKVPAIQMETEGERVLNKKKLDELVRQVCGGVAEGQDGNMLTPEVEESVLNLADSFVDNILHTACRIAKERGSKVLEIRDIQLVLERTYNIRIPGYSSDELRTVRKIQPSLAWVNKMSAVQAAKVMPAKNDS